MFMPRHPKPLLSTRAIATMVVQQRQRTPAMGQHVLIVESAKPLPAPLVPVKKD